MRARLELSLPEVGDKSGVALEKRLLQVVKSGGPRDERLDGVKIPAGFETVYARFWQLYRGERVTYSELDAFSRTTGIELTPLEIDAVMAMDGAAAAYMADRIPKPGG